MIVDTHIEDRIHALSPKAKEMFLIKLKESISLQTKNAATNQRKRIVAYIQGDDHFSVDQLKTDLQKRLPDYMVPSLFVPVKEMPLLPNGKINRKQLHRVANTIKSATKKVAITTSDHSKTEQQLLTIWEEVLGFSPIHKDDNFFEIGGDSILSIQIIAKARKEGIILNSNALFEHQTVANLSLFAEVENTKEAQAEEILTSIWEETLGFSPIHKDDNFFEIGGDSILSIQIIAKARKEGIVLNSNALFEHQTIAELSLFAKAESTTISNTLLEGEVPLSPIQYWFFREHKNAPQYWNQAVQLNNLPTVSENQIKKVTDYIITQHDVLRSRFTVSENQWNSYILSPEQIFALEYIDISNEASEHHNQIASEKLQHIQDRFKLSEGSLFKCIYFNTGVEKNNFCILVAHHLVVDAVSWKIITDDFKTVLQQVVSETTITQEAKTASVKVWNEYLNSLTTTIADKEISFWREQFSQASSLPYDKLNADIVEEKDIEQIHFSLDIETTDLIQEANKAYHTKTEELLVTALIHSIGNWSAYQNITIGFERHGRETLGSQLDVSKTVGWFTSYFPLRFTHEPHKNIANQIIAIKEHMRAVPQGGIRYGVLRYLKNAFGDIGNPEIVFNFLGTQFTTESDNDIQVTTLTKGLRSPQSERSYKLEINVTILNKQLHCNWSFGNTVYNPQTIALLINDFKNRLLEISAYCNQTENGSYTPSDFSEAEISQDDLDNLLDILD